MWCSEAFLYSNKCWACKKPEKMQNMPSTYVQHTPSIKSWVWRWNLMWTNPQMDASQKFWCFPGWSAACWLGSKKVTSPFTKEMGTYLPNRWHWRNGSQMDQCSRTSFGSISSWCCGKQMSSLKRLFGQVLKESPLKKCQNCSCE